jgi:DNA-binding protein HU-beta
MKKQDIIAFIAKDNSIPKTLAKKVFESTITCITQWLDAGQKVSIMWFGSFEKRKIARKLKAPNTAQAKVYNFTVVRFKQGSTLKS